MDYRETNAATAAQAVDSSETAGTDAVDADNVVEITAATGFIRTEAAPAEVPRQLKHRGSVTGIMAITGTTTGNRGIEVTVHSDSNGRDYKTAIWPPRQWTDNVFITGAELAALPAPEGVTEKGNPKQTPYQRFGRTINSTDGRAELQRVITAGTRADRTLNPNYTDFDTLVENLNTGLSGTPIIFVTGPDGDPDPEYGFRIKVKTVLPFDANFEKLRQDDAGGS